MITVLVCGLLYRWIKSRAAGGGPLGSKPNDRPSILEGKGMFDN
jgi:hypothetical protein